MSFPDEVTVSLTLRKVHEEETDGDDVWLMYALEGAPGIEVRFSIDAAAFGDEDMQSLQAALAEELAEEIVRVLRAAQVPDLHAN